MKRYGNLWHQIVDWSNLLLAARYAQKSKRFRDNVLAFNYNLEPELFKLQFELKEKTYCPGAYKSFRIYDPKPRLISAAPYRDRVVHHALCNIIVLYSIARLFMILMLIVKVMELIVLRAFYPVCPF